MLALARGFYLLAGLGALAMTGSHVLGAFQGSRFDPPIVTLGLLVGLLTLAAAAWVVRGSGLRAIAAWLGIVAGLAVFGVLLWIVATTAASAIPYAAVPTLIALAAAARMAAARLRADRGS
jgi:hypothetical protein